MKSSIIPKNIKKVRLEFWRGISFVEILIFFLYLLIVFSLSFFLGRQIILQVVFIIILSIVGIFLVVNVLPGVKGWYLVFLLLKFTKEKMNTKFISFYSKKINSEYIGTVNKNNKKEFISGIELKGFNIGLFSREKQNTLFSSFHNFFKNLNFKTVFLKMDLPSDYLFLVSYYKNKIDFYSKIIKISDELNKKILEKKINVLKEYINDLEKKSKQTLERKFFVLFYSQNEKEILIFFEKAIRNLNLAGFEISALKSEKIINLFNYLISPSDNEFFSESNEEQHKWDININPSNIKIKNKYINISTIHNYPLFPNICWGSNFLDLASTVVWDINPVDKNQYKERINKALNNIITRIQATKKLIDLSEQEYELEAYKELINDITGNSEVIKETGIYFINYGNSKNDLEAKAQKLKNGLKDINFQVNPLKYRQFDTFNSLLPGNYNHYGIENMPIPANALALSFPFVNGGLNDEQGLLLGKNLTSDNIIFNQFLLTHNRKNHNKIIIGTSGSGKSHTTKKEILYNIALDRKVIIIDPEREYKDLCNSFCGQWIDAGSGKKGRINPLQILDNNFKGQEDTSENSELDETNDSPVSNHLRFIDLWFKTLYPQVTDKMRRLLIQGIKMTYQKFNIKNSTNILDLKNSDFPIFTDVLHTLINWDSVNKNNAPFELEELIEIIQFDFTNAGQYEQLWNGHTNININSNLVVYDVWTLLDQDIRRVIAAQLHLILSFVKNEVKSNRNINNEILIVVDEAHLAIDKDNPVALNFLYQMAKRIRKYKGSLLLTTQNWNDFSGTEEIKKKTTAIVNNTQYSMIMNLAPSDLKDVMEVYRSYGGLSLEEQNYISRAGKGEMLLIVYGYDRHCLKVEINEWEEKIFKNEN